MAVVRDRARMFWDRVHVCAACDEPSPGPIKRLYYQPRKHGPFFPILEEQKKGDKASMFTGGRVPVCTSCASHLLRQWATFEKTWTPLEQRTYKLWAVERQQRAHEHRKIASRIQNSKQIWWKATKSLTQQQEVVDSLHLSKHDRNTDENSDGFRPAVQQGDTEEPGAANRFRLAVQQVQQDRQENTDSVRLRDVVPIAQDLNSRYDSPRNLNKRDGFVFTPPANQTNWETQDFREQLPRTLRESTDILIQKLAEIQYEENLRQSQETIREALDRVKKAQDRPRFVNTLGQELKDRLYGELEFRYRTRNLNEAPDRRALTKEDQSPEDLKHKEILQKLEREKKWQRRTESMMARQERMVEELRQEVKKEIKGVLEEQNKHYEELTRLLHDTRANLVPHNSSDHAYVSLDGSSCSESNANQLPASRKRRYRRDLTATEDKSSSATPEFYIQ